jgi:hypothetical protein
MRVDKVGDFRYYCWPGNDASGTQFEVNGRCWFYFSVTTLFDTAITLSIRGTGLTPKLYREGMKPVFRRIYDKKW